MHDLRIGVLRRLVRVREVVARFVIPADFVSAVPYGNGHINDTYAVTMSQGGSLVRYILQRINKRIFERPDLLMENILRVTEAAGSKASGFTDASRRNLTVIPARDGVPYVMDEDGEYWRAYVFVEQSLAHDVMVAYAKSRILM